MIRSKRTDGLAVIGPHQTDTLNYPVITNFAADQPAKIEKPKKLQE